TRRASTSTSERSASTPKERGEPGQAGSQAGAPPRRTSAGPRAGAGLGGEQRRCMTTTGDCAKRDEKMTPVLYFAYGSNLDDAQMRERCADARVLGRAT